MFEIVNKGQVIVECIIMLGVLVSIGSSVISMFKYKSAPSWDSEPVRTTASRPVSRQTRVATTHVYSNRRSVRAHDNKRISA